MSLSSLPTDASGWSFREGGEGGESIEAAGIYDRVKGNEDDSNS
jgi:hypothetical protein